MPLFVITTCDRKALSTIGVDLKQCNDDFIDSVQLVVSKHRQTVNTNASLGYRMPRHEALRYSHNRVRTN